MARTPSSSSLESKHIGSISYVGAPAKGARYTLPELHALIEEAIGIGDGVWGWKPFGLVVQFHKSGKTLGLAFRPGTGKDTGQRIVSFSAMLLEEYGPAIVRRSILHELCHHYRSERLIGGGSHDHVFCGALRKADPSVSILSCAKETAKPDYEPAAYSVKYLPGTWIEYARGRVSIHRPDGKASRLVRFNYRMATEFVARGGADLRVVASGVETTVKPWLIAVTAANAGSAFGRAMTELLRSHGWAAEARANPSGRVSMRSGWVV